MEKKIIGKNEVLFREGDLGDCFFLIEEGTAGIYLHYGEPEQQKLAEMKAGQFIGEMAVIEYWPRSTTVLAETELHLIEVKSGKLNDFFVEQPDRIMALMKQISMRIRTLTREYDEVCAFIREKQEARGENKESFLARMKKYRDHKKLADQLAVPTVEDKLLETKDGAADKSWMRQNCLDSCRRRDGKSLQNRLSVHGNNDFQFLGLVRCDDEFKWLIGMDKMRFPAAFHCNNQRIVSVFGSGAFPCIGSCWSDLPHQHAPAHGHDSYWIFYHFEASQNI